MKTKTPTEPQQSLQTDALSPTEIFATLAHDRRRYVLHYLAQRVGAVSLPDLGEGIALWEGEPTDDRYERVLAGLYHTHLPVLAEQGLVGYDLEREQVWLEDAADGVRPYLELSGEDDLRS